MIGILSELPSRCCNSRLLIPGKSTSEPGRRNVESCRIQELSAEVKTATAARPRRFGPAFGPLTDVIHNGIRLFGPCLCVSLAKFPTISSTKCLIQTVTGGHYTRLVEVKGYELFTYCTKVQYDSFWSSRPGGALSLEASGAIKRRQVEVPKSGLPRNSQFVGHAHEFGY